jgi:hypothetical protein
MFRDFEGEVTERKVVVVLPSLLSITFSHNLTEKGLWQDSELTLALLDVQI